MFYFPFLYICFLLSGLLFLKAFLNESVNSRMKPSFDVFPYVPYIVPDIARYVLESWKLTTTELDIGHHKLFKPVRIHGKEKENQNIWLKNWFCVLSHREMEKKCFIILLFAWICLTWSKFIQNLTIRINRTRSFKC